MTQKPPRIFTGQEERVETGPIQFGDDWPGIFIRGDNAGNFAYNLGVLLEEIDTDKVNSMSLAVIYGLRETLMSSILGETLVSNVLNKK